MASKSRERREARKFKRDSLGLFADGSVNSIASREDAKTIRALLAKHSVTQVAQMTGRRPAEIIKIRDSVK